LRLNVSDSSSVEEGVFEEVVDCDGGERVIGFDLDQNETAYQQAINSNPVGDVNRVGATTENREEEFENLVNNYFVLTLKPRIEQFSQVEGNVSSSEQDALDMTAYGRSISSVEWYVDGQLAG